MSTISAGRIDFAVIAALVKPGTKVLDVGCGDGDLLELLQRERNVDGRGIEISQKGVNECVARGLAVIQGDADSDLGFYQDKGFDYVVLSQTLQATRNPRIVLEHLLRIGERAIVSIPNFGHWRVRMSLFWTGRMPVTKDLPYTWYDTPNIHFCTIDDFIALCTEVGATIERAAALNENGERMGLKLPRFLWNFFGQQAVFLVRK
jgi:methionine biosynthesis protein MetW